MRNSNYYICSEIHQHKIRTTKPSIEKEPPNKESLESRTWERRTHMYKLINND